MTYEGPAHETFRMQSSFVSLLYDAKFMYNISVVWIRDVCIFRQFFCDTCRSHRITFLFVYVISLTAYQLSVLLDMSNVLVHCLIMMRETLARERIREKY